MRVTLMLLALIAALVPHASFAAPTDDARKADAELNAAYARVMQQLGDTQKESLRNAQRAWIAFRDSTCSFESELKSGAGRDWVGTQTNPAQDSFCIRRLTLERTAHLQRYADSLTRIASVPAPSSTPLLAGCRLDKLPTDFTVQAVGVYGGDIDTDIQLDAAGHETKSVDVVVNMPNANVVLVLMAYDPVVWQVKRTRASNIVAVIVGGYHAQAVLGIERSIPLVMSTYKGGKSCGQYFYAYEAGDKLLQANAAVKNLTGREMDQLWSSHRGNRVQIGTPLPTNAALVSSSDYKPEDYTDLPPFPSGQRGIDRLIQLGLLHRASSQDLDAWVDKASEKYKKFNQSLAVQRPFAPQGMFVVQGKMTFPAGLFGGHSVGFLIPPGVPLPEGNPGHSAIYFLEDGTCRGPICSNHDR